MLCILLAHNGTLWEHQSSLRLETDYDKTAVNDGGLLTSMSLAAGLEPGRYLSEAANLSASATPFSRATFLTLARGPAPKPRSRPRY